MVRQIKESVQDSEGSRSNPRNHLHVRRAWRLRRDLEISKTFYLTTLQLKPAAELSISPYVVKMVNELRRKESPQGALGTWHAVKTLAKTERCMGRRSST